MAKIKCEINEDSTLIRFEAVQHGEVFIDDNEPYTDDIKTIIVLDDEGFTRVFEERRNDEPDIKRD